MTAGGDSWGSKIAPHHRQMLEASAITAAQARARGYVSIDSGNRKRLEAIGIAKAARKSDGLLIPLLRIDGEVGGYQFRPDNPRVNKKGTEIKYETPVGQRNMIDFPPGDPERLADRSTPVWMTEGVNKGDAGACAGLAIVDFSGTSNWLDGGAALIDFRNIALKEREVIICFDSDVTIKPQVWNMAKELGEWLRVSKDADVKYCILPEAV